MHMPFYAIVLVTTSTGIIGVDEDLCSSDDLFADAVLTYNYNDSIICSVAG